MLKSEGEHVQNTSIWSLSQNLNNIHQKHSTMFQVRSCLKIDGHWRELKDFIFDMWDFLFGITKALRALRHSLKCILQVICRCFYLYVTYSCTWSHIERQKCMWQLWTVANSILNCEIPQDWLWRPQGHVTRPSRGPPHCSWPNIQMRFLPQSKGQFFLIIQNWF